MVPGGLWKLADLKPRHKPPILREAWGLRMVPLPQKFQPKAAPGAAAGSLRVSSTAPWWLRLGTYVDSVKLYSGPPNKAQSTQPESEVLIKGGSKERVSKTGGYEMQACLLALSYFCYHHGLQLRFS